MTPKAHARQLNDAKLHAACWVVRDYRQPNVDAALCIAVRKHSTETGLADYVLVVNCGTVGVINPAQTRQTLLTRIQQQRQRIAEM